MGEHERVGQVRSGELFVGVQQATAEVGGRPVPAPIFFPDVASVMVVLLAPIPAVRALLPSPRLRPVQVLPGRTFVWLSASDLRGGDLGPHQQLMAGVPVRLDGGGQGVLPALAAGGAWWALDMPVSSALARDVDVGVFGFPAEVAELDVRVTSTSAEVRWLHEGRMVLELDAQVRRARPYSGSRLRLESITAKDGRLLGAWWMLRIEQMSVSRVRPSIRLRLGDSPRADRLRGLGLEGRCLGLHVIPHAEGVLTPPVESWDAFMLPVRPRGERLVEVAR